jgi:hypothetical protein
VADNVLGRFQAQRPAVFEECLCVLLRVLADAHARRRSVLDDAVVHVREVHHLHHPKAARFQEAPQDVLKHERAEIPDVGKIVDGRSAGVHAHLARVERDEGLDAVRQRIVKADFAHRNGSRASV